MWDAIDQPALDVCHQAFRHLRRRTRNMQGTEKNKKRALLATWLESPGFPEGRFSEFPIWSWQGLGLASTAGLIYTYI